MSFDRVKDVFTSPYKEAMHLNKLGSASILSSGSDITYTREALPDQSGFLTFRPMGDIERDLIISMNYRSINDTDVDVDFFIPRNTVKENYVQITDINTGDITPLNFWSMNNITLSSGWVEDMTWEFYTSKYNLGKMMLISAQDEEECQRTHRDIFEDGFLELASDNGLRAWGRDLGVGLLSGWTNEIYRDILQTYKEFKVATPQTIKDFLDIIDGTEYNHIYEVARGPYLFDVDYWDTWTTYAMDTVPTTFEIQRYLNTGRMSNEEIEVFINPIVPVNIHWSITYPIPPDADEWTDTDFRNYQEQTNDDASILMSGTAGQIISNVREVSSITVKTRKVLNSFDSDYDFVHDISITESSGEDRVDEIITVDITGLNTLECFHDSIRVLDDHDYNNGSEVDLQVWDAVNDAVDGDFNFTNEADWAQPSGVNWTVVESHPLDQEVRILPHYMGFSKVLELKDSSSTAGHSCAYQYDMVDQPKGEIAFIFRTSTATVATSRYLCYVLDGAAGAAFIIMISTDTNKFAVWDGISADTSIDFAVDTWYYIRATFRCTGADAFDGLAEDKWKLYVTPLATGVEESTGEIGINGANPNIGQINFTTDFTFVGSHYIAVVDCSWFSEWYQGRINYLTDFKVSWLDSVGANSSVDRYLYYNTTTQGDPGYTGIIRTTNQVDCSDTTQYNFGATAGAGEITGAFLDKNGADWCEYAQFISSHLPAGTLITWLEEGAIFVECVYYDASDDYCYYKVFDNNLIKYTTKNDAASWYFRLYITNPFVDQFDFWNSPWGVRGVGSFWFLQEVQGYCYFHDNNDKTTMLGVWYDDDVNSKETDLETRGGDLWMSIGYDGIGHLAANTEYEFWFGLIDAESTTNDPDKRDKSYNMYVSLIDDPLAVVDDGQSPPGSGPLVDMTSDLEVELYEWDTDYATTIAGATVSTGTKAIGSIGTSLADTSINMTNVEIDEDKSHLLHFYTTGGIGHSFAPNYYDLRYYTLGSGAYQDGVEI